MSDREVALAIELAADLAEISRLQALVDEFADRGGLSPGLAATLNLVLEELVANTVMYGYADDGSAPRAGAIDIRLSRRGDVITLEVEDDAKPFDPLQRETPDIDAPLENREPGGLGIHFVRTLMDTVVYRRVGDRNRLTMTKNALPPPEDG